jgi:hypothetical protein
MPVTLKVTGFGRWRDHMSVLAWWVVPVAVALLIGGIARVWGRRPRFRRSFEEVEAFHGFLDALDAHRGDTPRRDDRPTA